MLQSFVSFGHRGHHGCLGQQSLRLSPWRSVFVFCVMLTICMCFFKSCDRNFWLPLTGRLIQPKFKHRSAKQNTVVPGNSVMSIGSNHFASQWKITHFVIYVFLLNFHQGCSLCAVFIWSSFTVSPAPNKHLNVLFFFSLTIVLDTSARNSGMTSSNPSFLLLVFYITNWLDSSQLTTFINSNFLDSIHHPSPSFLLSPFLIQSASLHSLSLREREVSVSVKQLNSDVNELIRCVNELATANPN